MYPVATYLSMLRLAKRSPQTIRIYSNVLERFSRCIGVPVDDLHNHLTPENIIRYAGSLDQSDRGTRLNLSVVHRYYTVNGVSLGELERNVLNPPITEPLQDKPITLDLLQRMMDVADLRGKAIISTLISTGMRPGECSRLTLDDYDGADTITIPNEIAKNKRGGKVYLTAEAQEFLGMFLKCRDEYIRLAHCKKFSHGNPADDRRLFGLEYSMLCNVFKRIYRKVDGERGRYRDRVTTHSTRKYFSTMATTQEFPREMVEHVMRHEGYLAGSYYRLGDEEIRAAFHASEDVLYITRRDRRHSENALEVERIKRRKLEEDMQVVKAYIAKMQGRS